MMTRRAAARRQKLLLADLIARAGLAPRERYVMEALAETAAAGNVVALFTSATAFEGAAGALMSSRRVRALSAEKQKAVTDSLDLLRGQINFGAAGGDGATAGPAADIRPGDRLTLVHRGQPTAVDLVVAHSTDDALVVEGGAAVDGREGETWLLRVAREGQVWEFDAPVVETAGQRVVLRRPARLRHINRRRFPRVPTDRAARVANFPLWREDDGADPQRFVPGRLVEIGGPGLKLQAAMKVRTGERVLVMVQFAAGAMVEALGKVRRVEAAAKGGEELAVELIGLDADEIAHLSRETNAEAVAAAHAPQPHAGPEPEADHA